MAKRAAFHPSSLKQKENLTFFGIFLVTRKVLWDPCHEECEVCFACIHKDLQG
jgi:hypothetical protein